MRSVQVLLWLLFLSFSCSVKENAQTIVDKSILAHGGDLYENSIVDFDFRGRHYTFERNNGLFVYHRIFEDSSGTLHDIYSNNGFKRLLNEKEIPVNEEWAGRYSSSINSVAYFSYLPFGLNDPAVNKNLIGEEEINEKLYYKIRVTFDKEGGGEDFDDVFVYWISKDTFRMDYFGYSYISDGGGIRFREAFNTRESNGLVYSDYINFKDSDDNKNVASLAELYKSGKLKKLSEIKIENLAIRRYN